MSRLFAFVPATLCLAGLVGEAAVAEDAGPSETGIPSVAAGESIFELGAGGDDAVRQAVAAYLQAVDEIERQAAEAKAAARKALLEKLGAVARVHVGKSQPGLIGTAVVDGERTGIAFHYHHGRLFPRESIRERFHKGEPPWPSVNITLVGYVDVPHDMAVKVWHAAGGVSGDHGELHVGGRLLGKVGDDIAKSVIYVVKLPQGRHAIRWVLTGGMFQHNLLKFEDPRTGDLLNVSNDLVQQQETGADRATDRVEAGADPAQWSKMNDPREWHWEPLGDLGWPAQE